MGKIMLVNGAAKRNDRGKTRLIHTCTNEEDRIRALKEYFGIVLTEEETAGIKERNVELL